MNQPMMPIPPKNHVMLTGMFLHHQCPPDMGEPNVQPQPSGIIKCHNCGAMYPNKWQWEHDQKEKRNDNA